MKKLLIITALLLFAGIAFGQAIQKGNLIGVHVISFELKPGATVDQFIDFFNETTKPAWEKAYGMKVFAMKGIRGEHINEFGMIIQYEDEASRDKYYNDDGTPSELLNNAMEELLSIQSEQDKIATTTSKYTDWILQ